MLLGAALQELKILQSKLSRLYTLRTDTFNVLENKEVEVEFDKISKEINELLNEIRALKVQIAHTNNTVTLDLDGKTITIQELIILISDLREELYQLGYLKPRGPVYLGGQAVEYVPQKKQDEMAELISELEERKAELDKILQARNWSTELIES
ncbi:MAG: hypothetical protein GF353_23495 [Candidatus Lokiarchaeota archaeon]|nr:hypothetical protein [Candidatus Lokiarchaeota archaeon]